ncbi:MAG: hypothetical protein KC535_01155 [Nanoarchaeota archaeon]|nr:hypothetical protein [Nanoarchaeota archaeon]
MDKTLYFRTKEIEQVSGRLNALSSSWSSSSVEVDVEGMQKNLFQSYEQNQVFSDAILKKQSIEDSLLELERVNKGVRKILPWEKNNAHNQRLSQLGELIAPPYHLKTQGVLAPDNFITSTLEMGAAGFALSYMVFRFLFSPTPDASPEEVQQLMNLKLLLPTVTTAIISPFYGFLTNLQRFNSLHTDQAVYLDKKIQEFYK